MVTRRKAAKTPEKDKTKHFCGECKHGVWVTESWDIDLKGKPICLRCPFVKNRCVIRTDVACDNFIKDVSKNWKKE